MEAKYGTLASGTVNCGGGWRNWLSFWKSRGGSISQSGWYLRIKRREEGTNPADSFIVESRRGTEVVEQKRIMGVVYDEETGEEEEWLMELGTERERRAWAAACRANHALTYCENQLGLANSELEACRARVLRHQCQAEDAWEEVDAMRAELVSCKEEMEEWRLRYEGLIDIIREAEEQLAAAEQGAGGFGGEDSGVGKEEYGDEFAEEGEGYMLLGGGQVDQERYRIVAWWGWILSWWRRQ